MEEMARKKNVGWEQPPDWMRELKGFEEIVVERHDDDATPAAHIDMDGEPDFPSGVWRFSLTLPKDLSDVSPAQIDPLLLAAGLAGGLAQVEEKLSEVVRHCRSLGKTWAQIGLALGMSKQAAWERFSGEE